MRLRIILFLAGISIFGGLVQLNSPHAEATLGKSELSIETDRHALQGTRGSAKPAETRGDGVSVHEIVSDSVRVREYLDKNGMVFGVAWRGLAQPNLSELLGDYYEDYQRAMSQPASGPRMRGSRKVVQASRVVVQKFGHMRSLRGRAYLPSMLPLGMNPNEIN